MFPVDPPSPRPRVERSEARSWRSQGQGSEASDGQRRGCSSWTTELTAGFGAQGAAAPDAGVPAERN